jgi:patatin-like phospholipase/acyl hydrolase
MLRGIANGLSYFTGSSQRTVAILSIDGGGMRGIIPLQILKRIELITNKKICEVFGYVIGASTGAIIAAAAGMNMPAVEIEKKYREDGPKIFDRTIWQKFNPADQLLYPQFQSAPLRESIEGYVGDIKLVDMPNNVGILTMSTTINGGLPVLFSKEGGKRNNNRGAVKVADAILASTAAPTYFNPHNIKIGDNVQTFIDGGMVANNPEAIGLNEAKKYFPNSRYVVLSLGTGHSTDAFSYVEGTNVGLIRLAANINAFASSIMSAQEGLQGLLTRDEEDHTNDLRFRIQVELTSEENQLSNATPGYLDQLVAKIDQWMLEHQEEMANLYRALGVPDDRIIAFQQQERDAAQGIPAAV